MHLKFEILFHSVIWRKSVTWNPWYNPWFNFLLFQDHLIIVLQLLLRNLKVSVTMWTAKGSERVFLSLSKKKIVHLLSVKKCYAFLSKQKLIWKALSEFREQPERRYRLGYINKQLSETLFCSLPCTCRCLLWILLLPLLGMRLCSDLAQECGTSHWGTAVSEHFPLANLNGESSFIHFAHAFNAFTKFIWHSSLVCHRVQIPECRSSATTSRVLASHGTRDKMTGLKDSWSLLSLRSPGFEGRGLSTEMFEHRNKEQLAPWDLFQEEGQQRKQQKECRKYQGWHCWRSEVRQDLQFKPLHNSVCPNAKTRFREEPVKISEDQQRCQWHCRGWKESLRPEKCSVGLFRTGLRQPK